MYIYAYKSLSSIPGKKSGERLQDHWSSGLIIVEPLLAKLHTIYRFKCSSTNHFEAKQASPIPCLG